MFSATHARQGRPNLRTSLTFGPGISLASFAIRRSFPKGRAQRGVETISELNVPIIFPFNGSARQDRARRMKTRRSQPPEAYPLNW